MTNNQIVSQERLIPRRLKSSPWLLHYMKIIVHALRLMYFQQLKIWQSRQNFFCSSVYHLIHQFLKRVGSKWQLEAFVQVLKKSKSYPSGASEFAYSLYIKIYLRSCAKKNNSLSCRDDKRNNCLKHSKLIVKNLQAIKHSVVLVSEKNLETLSFFKNRIFSKSWACSQNLYMYKSVFIFEWKNR